jgi:hypothetical protein
VIEDRLSGVLRPQPYGQMIVAGLASASIAIAINTFVLFAASWIPLVTAHGGLLKLIKPAATVVLVKTGIAGIWQVARLPASDSTIFKAGFHIAVGLSMGVFYALVVERLLRGTAWRKGLIYALVVWLMNAFVVLPAIGEGIAGGRHITLAGMVYFAAAHTIFFVILAILYTRFLCVAPMAIATAAERASRTSYTRRQARYEEVVRLRAEGISLGRVAAVLGVERKTVRRWLRLGYARLWKMPRRDGMLAPYQGFLDQRWTEGCRNTAQLWREVVSLGFGGRPETVRAWVTQRRKQTPAVEMQSSLPLAPAWHPPSSRRIGYMLMAEAEMLNEKERLFISHLLSEEPRLAEAIAVAKRLHYLLRQMGNETLQDVLAAAKVTLLADFAAGLPRDINAVQAALDLPWTTSPVEGQVNRIKMIKRTMYGRAGFDLLRARVLSAA